MMPELKDQSDEQLIQLLKKDDRAIFNEIYKRYAESLAGFAASKLYSLDDARDILHDLFVKLWEDRHSLTINGNLRSFLFAALRYRIVDKIRRNVTRQEYASALSQLENFDHGIEEHLEAKELNAIIDRSLDDLPPRTKQIYRLSRNEQHTIEDIAKLLGLSEQTVKNQLTTALKHVRRAIGNSAMFFIYWLLK